MKLICKLDTAVAGPGVVVKRGTYTGEPDALGVVWIEVANTARVPGAAVTKRIGIHVSKFSYVQEESAGPPVDKRAEVNAAIKAANAKAAEAAKKPAGAKA